MKGKKYIQRILDNVKLNSQLKLNRFSINFVSNDESFSSMTNSSRKSSQTMEHFVCDKKNVTNTEIIWTLRDVQFNFSLKSCESLPKLFQSMFTDSAIAKNVTFTKDKCCSYINYGIGPHYELLLIDQIKVLDYYSASFDESLNKITQKNQMNIYITYWNSEEKRFYGTCYS